METLAYVLSQKFSQFNTVKPGHALKDALFQMACEQLDYLIVAENGEFIGILSEQDITQKLFACNKDLEDLRVKDLMNVHIPVGSASDQLEFAIQLMNQFHSRYIAVFDEFEFKGIVSETDLLRQIIANSAVASRESSYQESFSWSY